MSITASKRKSIPSSKMGLPEQDKYPTDTRKRAIAAKSYSSQMEAKGLLSASQKAEIDSKANNELGKK